MSILYQIGSVQKTPLPTFPHHCLKNLSVKYDSFLCYEVNHNVEGQLIFFPSEATVGRAGNAVLPGICSRQQAVLSRWYNVSQVKVIHFAVLLKYYFIILSGYRILGETQNYIDRPHYQIDY